MCGIFGVVTFNGCRLSELIRIRLADTLALLAESRGVEASGIAVLDTNLIRVMKRPIAPRKLIVSDEYISLRTGFSSLRNGANGDLEARCIIGHARMATNGPSDTHNNNQPVVKHGIIGVHNGIIVNDEELWKNIPDRQRELTLDTEVLLSFLDLALSQGSDLTKAICSLYSSIEGAASCAFVFSHNNSLLLSTNTGSLYTFVSEKERLFLFCSELGMLKKLTSNSELKSIFEQGEISQIGAGEGVLVDIGTAALSRIYLREGTSTNPSITSALAKREIQEYAPPAPNLERGRANGSRESKSFISSSTHQKLSAVIEETYQMSVRRWEGLQRCSRCLLPSTFPLITFDSKGICNYCGAYDPILVKGRGALEEVISPFVRHDKKVNCLVGLSGGRDSCYALHFLKEEMGLTPVAFTYDWGMITDLARRNISRMCSALGVEHILVSANIPRKRAFIRKNVTAWLQRPSLGLIPLFMAGDKPYFYHAQRLKSELDLPLLFQAENILEKTLFKQGFAGVKSRKKDPLHVYTLDVVSKLKMLYYYGSNFLLNPALLNASLVDTAYGFFSYYLLKPAYFNLFNFIPWDEETIIGTLRSKYNWELAKDTTTTWRIGDGTAAFYNWIYYETVGFTEIDCFRSNQIREGSLTREEASKLVENENKPRADSIFWYCETNKIDPTHVVEVICSDRVRKFNSIP